MRRRVYVPRRIDSIETQLAVETLADALWKSGACGHREATERICRLLGWMCEQNQPETPPDDE